MKPTPAVLKVLVLCASSFQSALWSQSSCPFLSCGPLLICSDHGPYIRLPLGFSRSKTNAALPDTEGALDSTARIGGSLSEPTGLRGPRGSKIATRVSVVVTAEL